MAPMANQLTVGAQLASMRTLRELTRDQLAKKCRVSRQQIGNIEENRSKATLYTVLRMLRALDCYMIVAGPDGRYVVRENQDR